MKKNILVIGGHGAVGQIVVKKLHAFGYQNITIGGRNIEKMAAFSSTFTPNLNYQLLDISQNKNYEKELQSIDLVIVCIDQTNTLFVEQLIKLKIDYLDITANTSFLNQISSLNIPNDVSVVTSVGLAPGLTNLMAHHYLAKHPDTKNLSIDIILGLGEQHGLAAIQWMIDELKNSYPIVSKKKATLGYSFGHTIDFGEKLGKKRTYNFNFSDQHHLNHEFPNTEIVTHLGFDINSMAKGLAFLRKTKLLNLTMPLLNAQSLQKMMAKKTIGTDIFAVNVSNGTLSDPNAIKVVGNNEKKVTGEIAADVAKKLLESNTHFGQSTITDICTIKDLNIKVVEKAVRSEQ